ncbi:hypothetical protein CONPUDRAFT_73038 [Coniophora puteana RWD-64-598 SS2]|uniref:Uncharacterized protein n=1 Tax=Coniophora puteana (strain RWD-64-598) TaxID=741705 RepID=A0A5M3MQC2_CONPW|nr:uncharacterized protein CONPUDRAFT_73038 [Coniophora puteana RWD-64-598 SS2]EIW81256.1 hypothetical protein CONPUDRAFT_73038 [Coniophora puteana RWD-64-598 SS2]
MAQRDYPVDQCTCRSQGCSLDPQGFKLQDRPVANSHMRRDQQEDTLHNCQEELRQLSLPQCSNTQPRFQPNESQVHEIRPEQPDEDENTHDAWSDDDGDRANEEATLQSQSGGHMHRNTDGNLTDEEDLHECDGSGTEAGANDPFVMLDCLNNMHEGWFNLQEIHDLDVCHNELPPAFQDHHLIRSAYIRVFVGVAFMGNSNKSVQLTLKGVRSTLMAISRDHAGINFAGLEDFAVTLPTVLKHLSLSTANFIVYLFICPDCWAVHHPSDLLELKMPSCAVLDCPGMLYCEKCTSEGQPGKWEQFQHWRGPDDTPGWVPPSAATGFEVFDNSTRPMSDIYDDWGWHTIQAGLQRRRHSNDAIEDVDVQELDQRFVALPCGLVLQFNLDWFQSTKHDCHLTGVFYVIICNNPRQICYLAEETMLVMILPGPNKPNLWQLNNLTDV